MNTPFNIYNWHKKAKSQLGGGDKAADAMRNTGLTITVPGRGAVS